jgi:uncharacterized membrane protein
MNSVQLHLALTHVPVILSLVGLIILIIGLLKKNSIIVRTSLTIIAIAGITALPVYFSGEEAEEAVEHIAGISESLIEEHEEIAKYSLISILISGLMALVTMFSSKWPGVHKHLKTAVLFTAFISAGLMVQTAHTGGQIRHSEMNGETVAQNDNERNTEFNTAGKEDDDD